MKLCDRNFGIGGDGVIFALPPAAAGQDYVMRIFNNDGSEPEMCGNGIRCLARFVAAADGAAPRAYRVGTGAGVMAPSGRPAFGRTQLINPPTQRRDFVVYF